MTTLTHRKPPKKEESKTPTTQPLTTKEKLLREPLPKLSYHKIWSRCTLILGVLVYVWYTSKDSDVNLARQSDILTKRGQSFECDRSYAEEIGKYAGCAPKKCGRFVMDKLVSANEADMLLNVAKRGISLGGSEGGASILDLHSGALSHRDHFINVYNLPTKFISASDLAIYRNVRERIQKAIATNFGLDEHSLHLTHPTFFSRLTADEPRTKHDEYWHVHVDKETYESFHYTSLVYLTDYGVDFQGGRFIFNGDATTKNVTVEPRKGRVLMFTSGQENPHHVERVTAGHRFAITVSFTCDPAVAIQDPRLQ